MFVKWIQIILISCMSVSLLVSLLPYWDYVNIGIFPVLDEISFWFFCLSVCQSLISLPIGHFWGSTSETSGLVYLNKPFVLWSIFSWCPICCSPHYQMIQSLLPTRLRTAWTCLQMRFPACPRPQKFCFKSMNPLFHSLAQQELRGCTQQLNNAVFLLSL